MALLYTLILILFVRSMHRVCSTVCPYCMPDHCIHIRNSLNFSRRQFKAVKHFNQQQKRRSLLFDWWYSDHLSLRSKVCLLGIILVHLYLYDNGDQGELLFISSILRSIRLLVIFFFEKNKIKIYGNLVFLLVRHSIGYWCKGILNYHRCI